MGVLKANVGGLWVPVGGPAPPPASLSYSKYYAPPSNIAANAGGGYTDWLTLDAAVPVPVWATKFSYRVAASYLMYQTAGADIYGVRLCLGAAQGLTFNFDDCSKAHFDINFLGEIAVIAPGTNQALKIQANRVAGTGTWVAGNFGSTIGVTIDWYA
jgi:hypothetical protein